MFMFRQLLPSSLLCLFLIGFLMTGECSAQGVKTINSGGARSQSLVIGRPTDPGFDAKAIARWDAVPYQTVDGVFELGVVAFHINGIDYVEFSMDRRVWQRVEEMRLNPRTGVWEYWIELDAADFKDGPVEISARAVPRLAGQVRVLDGPINEISLESGQYAMVLYMNAAGTLPRVVRHVAVNGSDFNGDGSEANPFRSVQRAARSVAEASGGELNADGGLIYLHPGDHRLGTWIPSLDAPTRNRWLTIAPAPGSKPAAVRITGSASNRGLHTARLHLKDLTIVPDRFGDVISTLGMLRVPMVWLDGCSLKGRPEYRGDWLKGWQGVFVTDASVEGTTEGLRANLLRSVDFVDIGGNALADSRLAIDVTLRDVRPQSGGAHNAAGFVYNGRLGPIENIILYNVLGLDTSGPAISVIRGFRVRDVALVNVLVDQDQGVAPNRWVASEFNHVLLWHVTLPGATFEWKGLGIGPPRNLSVVGSVFGALASDIDLAGAEFVGNHVVNTKDDSGLFGKDTSTGDPGFINAAQNDFGLRTDSPLRDRVSPRIPADLAGVPLGAFGPTGSLAYNPDPDDAGIIDTLALSNTGKLVALAFGGGFETPGGDDKPIGPDGAGVANPNPPVVIVMNSPIGGGGGFNPPSGGGSDPDHPEVQDPPQDDPIDPIPDSVLATLIPGPGWSGPTPQPAAVGNPGDPGYDAKAIARWDVVPYQTFDGIFEIGVVAFHMNGIDRVEFSVENGPWIAVEEMTLNPRTNVWEYWARVDASDFESDGAIELRAIAWPQTGIPRLLEPLTLFSNGQGSLPSAEVFVSPDGDDINNDGSLGSPFKSIFRAGMAIQNMLGNRADGGIISLLPGDHIWGTAGFNSEGQYIGNLVTVDRWLEVRPALGVDPSTVRITSTGLGGLKTARVLLNGLTLLAPPINSVPTGTLPKLWLNDCTMIGGEPTTDIRWTPGTGYTGGMYVTNCEVVGGRYGFLGARLVRNVTIEGIGDDAFTNNQMVVNAEVRNQWIPPGSGFHTDVVQLHASATPFENVIVYNVRAIDCGVQPWHIGYTGHVEGPVWSDIAFVNFFVENELVGATAQWTVSANHVLWWHIGILGSPTLIRDSPQGGGPNPPTTIQNFSMRHCIFEKFSMSNTGLTPKASDPSWAHGNHFRDASSFGAMVVGTDATMGGTLESLFVNPAANDYRPAASSLLDRITEILTPADALGWPVEGAIGPLQP